MAALTAVAFDSRLIGYEVLNMDPVVSERARAYFDKVVELAPIIREHADRAEREAQMPREVADACHEAGMFRMLLRRSMGGGEVTILDSLRLCEEVARVDASAGWNLAICSRSEERRVGK